MSNLLNTTNASLSCNQCLFCYVRSTNLIAKSLAPQGECPLSVDLDMWTKLVHCWFRSLNFLVGILESSYVERPDFIFSFENRTPVNMIKEVLTVGFVRLWICHHLQFKNHLNNYLVPLYFVEMFSIWRGDLLLWNSKEQNTCLHVRYIWCTLLHVKYIFYQLFYQAFM